MIKLNPGDKLVAVERLIAETQNGDKGSSKSEGQ